MQPPGNEIPPVNAARDSGIAKEVSLVRGGPFYRGQEATRLVTPERWNLGRRIALSIGLTWAPLVLITLLSKPHAIGGLLKDYTINVRLLMAIPVLLIGQVVMENAFRTIVRHIREAKLLAGEEQARMDLTISNLIRFRDSVIPEIVILIAAYLVFLSTVRSRMMTADAWALSDSSHLFHLSLAGWYFAFVSQLVYHFLLGLSIGSGSCGFAFFSVSRSLIYNSFRPIPTSMAGSAFLGCLPSPSPPQCLSYRRR
jgi:hypothetical protein